jgi:hypothetical protein
VFLAFLQQLLPTSVLGVSGLFVVYAASSVTGQIIGDAANLLVGVTGYFHFDNAQHCRQLWLFIHRCCHQLWLVLLTFVTCAASEK